MLDKIDKPLHKLCAPAMIFRAIIEIDHPCGDRGEPLADGLPPLGEAISQAVPGAFRGHAVHKQFIQRGEEDAHGGHRRIWSKVVIGRRDLRATLPCTCQRADLDGRLGVE